jgi:hypothetical protein
VGAGQEVRCEIYDRYLEVVRSLQETAPGGLGSRPDLVVDVKLPVVRVADRQ